MSISHNRVGLSLPAIASPTLHSAVRAPTRAALALALLGVVAAVPANSVVGHSLLLSVDSPLPGGKGHDSQLPIWGNLAGEAKGPSKSGQCCPTDRARHVSGSWPSSQLDPVRGRQGLPPGVIPLGNTGLWLLSHGCSHFNQSFERRGSFRSALPKCRCAQASARASQSISNLPVAMENRISRQCRAPAISNHSKNRQNHVTKAKTCV